VLGKLFLFGFIAILGVGFWLTIGADMFGPASGKLAYIQQAEHEFNQMCESPDAKAQVLCDNLTVDMQTETIQRHYDAAVSECGDDAQCIDTYVVEALFADHPEHMGKAIGGLAQRAAGGFFDGFVDGFSGNT